MRASVYSDKSHLF